MPDRSPARWRPHLKLMLAIGSVLVAIGLLTAFLATQQRSPGEATRVPPAAATPGPTVTAPASPVAVAWPPGSLPALLSIAPDFLDDNPRRAGPCRRHGRWRIIPGGDRAAAAARAGAVRRPVRGLA
jgi:hypothetical protein